MFKPLFAPFGLAALRMSQAAGAQGGLIGAQGLQRPITPHQAGAPPGTAVG